MEPFGLFQFLKTFMQPTPSENASSPPENAPFDAQNDEPSMLENGAQAEENSSSIDAVLQFMDAHERRAKPHRKP